MADPRPLTRAELAEFLPNQRAIRAFEKLFEIVPPELENTLLLAESSLLPIGEFRSHVNRLDKRIEQLEIELAATRKTNLDQILNRLHILETLEG